MLTGPTFQCIIFSFLFFIAPFVTVRRCARCKEVGHEQFTTSQSFKLFHCDICESFLWDHEGIGLVLIVQMLEWLFKQIIFS